MKHYKQLTSEQRYQMSGLKKAGLKLSQIADEVGVHKSTISREFKRNKGLWGELQPANAPIVLDTIKTGGPDI